MDPLSHVVLESGCLLESIFFVTRLGLGLELSGLDCLAQTDVLCGRPADRSPLSSNSQRYEIDDCLENNREDY